MQDFEIIFYQLPDGTEPVRDFLLGLDIKMRAKLMHNMEILQQQGINAREPYSKPIEDGIFEIRAQTDGNISRVLYFFFVGRKIVLTRERVKPRSSGRGRIAQTHLLAAKTKPFSSGQSR